MMMTARTVKGGFGLVDSLPVATANEPMVVKVIVIRGKDAQAKQTTH
jgi:hypothetical protein